MDRMEKLHRGICVLVLVFAWFCGLLLNQRFPLWDTSTPPAVATPATLTETVSFTQTVTHTATSTITSTELNHLCYVHPTWTTCAGAATEPARCTAPPAITETITTTYTKATTCNPTPTTNKKPAPPEFPFQLSTPQKPRMAYCFWDCPDGSKTHFDGPVFVTSDQAEDAESRYTLWFKEVQPQKAREGCIVHCFVHMTGL